MKRRRLILIVSAAFVAVAVLVGGYLFLLERNLNNEPPVDGQKISTAVDAFARDLAQRGQPLPPSVTLQQLIAAGHLRAEDVRQFAGAEVTISLTNNEMNASAVQMRVHRPGNPDDVVVLADGSIQPRTSTDLRRER